jgi:hypothetical protein
MRIPSVEPVYLLWSYRTREPSQINILRACHAYRAWSGNERVTPGRVGRHLVPWLIRFPVQLVRALRRFGPAARAAFGRPLPLQAMDMVRLAVSNDLRPIDYYRAALARCDGGEAMFAYVSQRLYEQGAKFCCEHFHPRDREPNEDSDKLAVERRCRELGFPCTETIATVAADGTVTGIAEPFAGTLPGRTLFLKPARGTQGKGAERWDFGPRGFTSKQLRKGPLTAAELVRHAQDSARALRSDILVQNVLKNDPRLEALVGEAIATARISTVSDAAGEPAIVQFRVRIAGTADSPTDNYHAGGIAFEVDAATGVVVTGRDQSFASRPCEIVASPVTGALLRGVELPHWRAARDLVRAMHRAFGWSSLMGWDIALTADGPVMVETTAIPGIDPVVQIQLGGFIGSDLAERLTRHIRAGLDEALPADSRFRVGADRGRAARSQ